MGDEQHYGYGIDYGWDEIMERKERGGRGEPPDVPAKLYVILFCEVQYLPYGTDLPTY